MTTKRRPMSDEAVRAATGKDWQGWFTVLDAAGARAMAHMQIAAYLNREQGVAGWWSQMVANGYERARGLRDKHQMPDGYQISASKTLGVPLAILYQAWSEPEKLRRWLAGEPVAGRKATPGKSLRLTWRDGPTTVEVNFYGKGQTKSQVTVQHSKLATADDAERMKAYWKDALQRLELSLDQGNVS